MAIHRGVLAGIIIFFSFFAIKGSMGENKTFAFVAFLVVIIAGLVLYQSFDRWVPQTAIGIVGFFVGRLLFVGMILYADYLIMNALVSDTIQKDAVQTYGVAGGISSRYLRGKRDFYRHFRYIANGSVVEKKVRFSYDLNRGDTLYLKYSKSNPHIFEFVDNEQNRRHGIFK